MTDRRGAAEDGGSQLIVVAVDQGANLRVLRHFQAAGRIRLVQAHSLEQSFRQVRDQGRVFRIGTSTLGGMDMLGAGNVYAVEEIVGRENFADIEHVYASWLSGNDYFVTENVNDFICDGRREKLEAVLTGLLIRTTDELLRELQADG